MNYLAYLFLSHLAEVTEEVRWVDGKEQVCLVIPTETNQLKRGKRGNWLMTLRMSELPPNATMQTHVLQLGYVNYDEVHKARLHGTYERSQRIGNVYEHDRTPEKKVDRRNPATDVTFDGYIILSDIPKQDIFLNDQNGKRYISDLSLKCDNADAVFTGFLCVDDIPADCIKQSPRTGKKYIECRFSKSEYLDTYMNTHHLVIVKPDGSEIEIGRFKEWVKMNGQVIAPPSCEPTEQRNDNNNQRQVPHSIDGIKF